MGVELTLSQAATGAAQQQPPGERETVVLLHASASSARQWDALARSLPPSFEVHAIDLHGHGRQPAWSHAGPMALRDEAALVLPLLQRAGGVHLVGHSYGGAVAMYLASEYPALVRSLALFEPVLLRLLSDADPQGAPTLAVRAAFDDVGALLSQGEELEAARVFVDYWSGAGAWVHLPPAHQQHTASRMRSVAQQFHVVCHESLPAARIASLRMPTLCLSGGRTTASAAGIAGLLRGLLPQAQHHVLPGMGHMGPVTHAVAVNDMLAAFLAAQVP